MAMFLLLALILVPLLEIAVFIQVGGLIGLWPTLGLVVLTAFAGTWHLRAQGLATLARARAELDQGRLPTRELFDGFCIVIAGALLLTPGFITDFVGALLLLPPVRAWLRSVLARHFEGRVAARVYVAGDSFAGSPGERPRESGPGPVIEGEYREVEEQNRRRRG